MTRREQRIIRDWWPHYKLRFRADGTVEARSGVGRPWGLLYTVKQARAHIESGRP